MALGEASVRVVPDTKGFGDKLKSDVGKGLKGVDDSVKKSTDAMTKQFQQVGKAIAGAFVAKQVINFTKASIAAAEAASTSRARIEQIATSMNVFGDNVSKVTDRLVEYANQTAKQTGIDQNQIKLAQAKLLTFKNLAVTAETMGGAFDRATQAAIDMGAAGFGDAANNAVQLGKALQDPIKGITALSRSGITFTAQQKELIRTLVETNQIGVAQDIILKAIEEQVGGTAVATANASDKMKVAFSMLQEEVGNALLPAFTSLTMILQDVFAAFGALPDGIQKVIVMVGLGVGAFYALSLAVQKFGASAAVANPIIAGIGIALIGLVGVYSILRSRSEEARARQEELNTALVNANDPTLKLMDQMKGLITTYNELNPASAEATDGVTGMAGALDFTRSQIVKFLPNIKNAGVSLDDLSEFASTGTDAFGRLYRAINQYGGATVPTSQRTREFAEALDTAGITGTDLEPVLKNLAASGGLTTKEFQELLYSLSSTSGAFEDQRNEIDKQNEAMLTSTDGVKALSGMLGDELFGMLVANADELANNAGRTDEWTWLLEELARRVQGLGYELDTTGGELDVTAKATDGLADSQEDLEDATAEATAEIEKQQEALDRLLEATLAQFSSEIRLAQSKRDTSDAIGEYNTLVQQLEDGTYDGSDAFRDLAEASENVYEKSLTQAQGMVDLAVDTATAAGEIVTAEEKQKLLRDELIRVAQTLDPNSPLRRELLRYASDLDAIPSEVNTTIRTNYISTEERRVSNQDAAPGGVWVNGVYFPPGIDFSKLANGKIVTSPEFAMIGEAGPEVVIPLTRPARALELMRESGLIGMSAFGSGDAMPSSSMAMQSKATVNIESANFYDGTDANLVAQKVNAAQQARSFSR